ncbi:cyclin-K-like [Teleopsis dalmanni]|uniref:cyclin-K-like n=1 Tax=Teleopsis dalmanni TaxID=139649 RepID=UPI0018CE8B31|nr:cyclin-K-like [Teleopsis dalmanni]
MPCWYYTKKELRETPSLRDGIPPETEQRYRKEGVRFIMTCGTNMGLGHNTMATGVVYFHRFYRFRSFKSFPRYLTACCCLFLAGKVEETPKKCRDIIKTARSLLSDSLFYSFGDDPKEEVMTLERILLQTIKFDLQVEHPYSFLLKYAKCLKGDPQRLQKMVQMAWNFVNDSLSTVVCLQWEPEIIAVALIHLASKLSKITIADWVGRTAEHQRWWDMFVSDVTMEILEDICHQVLDLYQSNQKIVNFDSSSPPQKPPSRADSPDHKSLQNGQTTINATKTKMLTNKTNDQHVVNAVTSNTSAEINNIQTITSLANSNSMSTESLSAPAPIATYHLYPPPPPPPPPQIHTLLTNAVSPPPPPQSEYATGNTASTSNVSNFASLPLPLPTPPYVMAPNNNWAPSLANAHYARVPPPIHRPTGPMPHVNNRVPPPMPPNASSGFFQGSNFGRQPRY